MIGFGYDIHQLAAGGSGFMLGGVKIDSDKSVVAHSDGDVAIHALCDALLGAIGMGDIGEHFPNTNPEYHRAPSVIFLRKTLELVSAEGYRLINADISIVLERPKILPYKNEIRVTLAEICGVAPRRISVKATTNEQVGCVGRGEAVAAFAVCLVEPIEA